MRVLKIGWGMQAFQIQSEIQAALQRLEVSEKSFQGSSVRVKVTLVRMGLETYGQEMFTNIYPVSQRWTTMQSITKDTLGNTPQSEWLSVEWLEWLDKEIDFHPQTQQLALHTINQGLGSIIKCSCER